MAQRLQLDGGALDMPADPRGRETASKTITHGQAYPARTEQKSIAFVHRRMVQEHRPIEAHCSQVRRHKATRRLSGEQPGS